jgi:hypothetical protein
MRAEGAARDAEGAGGFGAVAPVPFNDLPHMGADDILQQFRLTFGRDALLRVRRLPERGRLVRN